MCSGEKERVGQELALVRHELSVLKQKETDILTQMEDLKHEKVMSCHVCCCCWLADSFLLFVSTMSVLNGTSKPRPVTWDVNPDPVGSGTFSWIRNSSKL